jgi:two-component system OmpR family sensor kinase
VVDALADLPEAAERTVTLGFPRAPRRLPPVFADADLLFLALYNLLANAVKYSSAGDTIEVRGAEDDGIVTIEIADTGMGIPEDEQSVVWEELTRGSEARVVPGSGLGLPFVRAIVQRHGGSVELRSRPQEGTLVRVSLPQPSTPRTPR